MLWDLLTIDFSGFASDRRGALQWIQMPLETNPEEQLSETQDPEVISHGAHQPSACRNCTSILYSLYVSER